MEPREASHGLHTQEVTGSSPVAPTIHFLLLRPLLSRAFSSPRCRISGVAKLHHRFHWNLLVSVRESLAASPFPVGFPLLHAVEDAFARTASGESREPDRGAPRPPARDR
jgi:hypothetical protein